MWAAKGKGAMYHRPAQGAPGEKNQLDRLLLFRWTGGLIAVLLALTTSFFLFGFWYPYWRIADQDLMMVYNALLLNGGLPQEQSDHPAYLVILEISAWFRLLHAIGWLDAFSISTLPPASDTAAFDLAWTHAIRAARITSLVNGFAFVVAFAFLLRRLVDDWRVAALGTFALAFSGGLAMSLRAVKSELLSTACATSAILILLIAAQRPGDRWRPLWIGLAGCLCVLALENKVHAIFLIGAVPLIVLPFGRSPGEGGFWRDRKSNPALFAMFWAALCLAIPAGDLVLHALSADAVAINDLRPIIGGIFGISQALMAAWIAAGVIIFALIWQVPIRETLASSSALLGGISLGLLALHIVFHSGNAAAVVNPLEQLFHYAGSSVPQLTDCQSITCGPLARVLIDGAIGVFTRRTFVLETSPRPAIFLEWLVIAGAIIAFRRGETKLVLQVGALMVSAWAIDALGVSRGLKQEYFLYTDPLVIIAACWLLARMVDLQRHRWTFPVGAALIGLHLAFSQAEPIKHSMMRAGPESNCYWIAHYLKRVGPFPFCRG
jgi:hypothetical protein